MRTILIVIIFLLSACRQTSKQDNQADASNHKTLQEKKGKTLDTASVRMALKHHLDLIKEFNDTISTDIDSNYYRLILYGAFRNGTAVTFVKKGNDYFMSVKTLDQDSTPKLKKYSTKIDKEEWGQLENMVDNFNFWTEEQFTFNEVLDGYVFYLEANRFSDNQKIHRIVGRGSPHYDKIGALCHYIIDFQESLVFKYKQINR